MSEVGHDPGPIHDAALSRRQALTRFLIFRSGAAGRSQYAEARCMAAVAEAEIGPHGIGAEAQLTKSGIAGAGDEYVCCNPALGGAHFGGVGDRGAGVHALHGEVLVGCSALADAGGDGLPRRKGIQTIAERLKLVEIAHRCQVSALGADISELSSPCAPRSARSGITAGCRNRQPSWESKLHSAGRWRFWGRFRIEWFRPGRRGQ